MTKTIRAFTNPLPTRDDRANYDANADGFMREFPGVREDMNAQNAENNALALQVTEHASAALGATAPAWRAGYFVEGQVVYSPRTGQYFRRASDGDSLIDPGVTIDGWVRVPNILESQQQAEQASALADQARNEAAASAALAAAARDAATVNANVYASEAAALADAGLAVGGQFLVLDANGLVIRRFRKDAGPVATLLATYQTAAVVAANPDSMDRFVVLDEQGQVALRVDALNRMHVEGIVSKDGYISGAVGVVDVPLEGVSTLTVDADGKVLEWTPEFPAADGSDVVLPDAGLSLLVHSPGTVDNLIYNQWVGSIFHELADGRILGNGIGIGVNDYYGGLLMGRRAAFEQQRDSAAVSVNFARVRGAGANKTSDDHNPGAFALDLRPGAEWPLMIFSTEHNGYSPTIHKARSLDITKLVFDRQLPVADTSYSQPFRNPSNPDEMLHVTRSGGVAGAAWVFLLSSDNGKNWMPYSVLSGPSLYILGKESIDGNSVFFGAHEHPVAGTDQRILLLRFDWASKALVFPGDGGTFIADIRTAPALNPFAYSGAFAVYTPTAGRRTRLFDLAEVSAGTVHLSLADFNSSSVGTYKHVAISVASATASVTDLGDCGSPVEVPAGGNAYFGGVAIHGVDRAVVTKWMPTNHALGLGTSTLALHTLTGGAWAAQTLVTVENEKLMRPFNVQRVVYTGGRQRVSLGRWVAYTQGIYDTFTNFRTLVRLLELP